MAPFGFTYRKPRQKEQALQYVDPQSCQEWQDVASERASDAAALGSSGRSVATIYMLGFAIESYAKALCIKNGVPVPKGRDGHDIITILNKAGINRLTLPLAVRKFAEDRDVGLRYQVTLPPGTVFADELKSAQQLAKWCLKKLYRNDRRR